MPDYPEILVLRHGQTVWNREGRHQGQGNSPLTEKGEGQARDMGGILKRLGVDSRYAAFVSPLGRAMQTADLALPQVGLTARPEPRIMEVAFGDYEGKTLDEIALDHPHYARLMEEDPLGAHFATPGGETFADMEARCRAFLDELTGPSVLVCHGITSRVLRGIWLGLDLPGMAELEGGQGMVYQLVAGQHHRHDP